MGNHRFIRFLAWVTALCLLGGTAAAGARAATATDISACFTDPLFRWLVKQQIHDIWAGPITEATAAAITELAIPEDAAPEIRSLAGLEFLTGLKDLDISLCPVTEPFVLPASLERLRCRSMGLRELPVLPEGLRWLDCSDNALSHLQLSGCPRLEYIDCRKNYLSQRPALAGGEALWDQDDAHWFSPQLQPGDRFVSAAEILPGQSFAVAGRPLLLSAEVMPENASIRQVLWSVSDPGKTGAVIEDGWLTAQEEGTALLEARVPGGSSAEGEDLTALFELPILPAGTDFPAVGIADLPTWAPAGAAVPLRGSVVPSYAAAQSIQWGIHDDGGTGAVLEGDVLRTGQAGLLQLWAEIANATGSRVTQVFSLTVAPEGSVPVDLTAGFTDSRFRAVVYALIGKGSPAPIYDCDLAGIEQLVFAEHLAGEGVESLSGLQYLSGLQTLDLRGSSELYALPALPPGLKALYTGGGLALLPPLPEGLELLVCAGSGLSSLPQLPASLRWLDCAGNRLDSLDVTGLPLDYLDCRGNLLPGHEAVTGFAGAFDSGEAYRFVPQHLPEYVAVTGITDLPAVAAAGTALTLRGRVLPENASSSGIVWRVENPGTTGAQLEGAVLHTSAGGTVTLTAEIPNGRAPGLAYSQSFQVAVETNEPFVAVRSISGIPWTVTAGQLELQGNVLPANASRSEITWRLEGAVGAGAQLTGTLLQSSGAGKVYLTAIVPGGRGPGEDFTQPFVIEITHPSLEITADFSVLNPRHTGQLDAPGAVGTLYYSCLNESVVSVSADGTVLGKRPGVTTVYVETSSGQSEGYQVQVRYSVGQWLLVIFLFGFLWVPIG